MTTEQVRVDLMRYWPVLAFLIAQTGTAVWWAATASSQINELQKDNEKLEEAVDDLPDIKASLKNIEKLLERAERASQPNPFR